jgi:hypothetical protein
MANTALVNKLSRVSALTAISVAMLATVGTAKIAPATAATFTINGRFATQSEAGSSGLAVNLQGGSFDGTYEVDGLPAVANNVVILKSWQVNLRNPLGNILKTYSSTLPNLGAGVFGQYDRTNTDVLLFADINSQFQLNFPTGFIGKGAVLPRSVNPAGTVYPSAYFVYNNGRGFRETARLNVVSGESKSVPEPSAVAAIGIFGLMSWLCKRTSKAV